MAKPVPIVNLRRLFWVSPVTIVAATVGVLIVRLVGVAIVRPDPAFPHLAWLPPKVFTVFLVIGAVLVGGTPLQTAVQNISCDFPGRPCPLVHS